MRSTRLMLGLAVVLAFGAAVFMGSISNTTEAKLHDDPTITFEFSITFDEPQIATEIVALTLCAANIGSSGLDGVPAPKCDDDSGGTPFSSNFQVDSFFDVQYRTGQIFGDPDFDKLSTIDIEIVALQLVSIDPFTGIEIDPADAIEDVRAALETKAPVGYLGHVTVLK